MYNMISVNCLTVAMNFVRMNDHYFMDLYWLFGNTKSLMLQQPIQEFQKAPKAPLRLRS